MAKPDHHDLQGSDFPIDNWTDDAGEITSTSITAARANVKVGDTVEIGDTIYKVLEVDYYPGFDDQFTASLAPQKVSA